jgi:hypothetical protein
MRLLNRPLALILAAALAAASIVVIIEVIGFALHSGHSNPVVVPWRTWYHWARTTRWDDQVIRVWSAILIAGGVLLAGFEIKPRRVTHHHLDSGTDATETRLTRRGLSRSLGAAATGVDGISGTAVSVRRRRARITATATATGRNAAAALTEPVTEALRRRLDDLKLQRRPRLKVRVHPGSR